MGAPVDSSDLKKEIVLVFSIKQARIKSTKEQPEDKRIIVQSQERAVKHTYIRLILSTA